MNLYYGYTLLWRWVTLTSHPITCYTSMPTLMWTTHHSRDHLRDAVEKYIG